MNLDTLVFDTLAFPVTVATLVIALTLTVVGSVILWLTGLLVAFIFFAISIGILYTIDKLEIFDVEKNRWLLTTPFIMFFVGLGLDKVDILSLGFGLDVFSVQDISFSGSIISFSSICLVLIVTVLIAVLVVHRNET